MTERFKIYLNDSGEINFRIENNNYKLSKTEAVSMKYNLYQIIGRKLQWDDIHDWKASYVDNEDEV